MLLKELSELLNQPIFPPDLDEFDPLTPRKEDEVEVAKMERSLVALLIQIGKVNKKIRLLRADALRTEADALQKGTKQDVETADRTARTEAQLANQLKIYTDLFRQEVVEENSIGGDFYIAPRKGFILVKGKNPPKDATWKYFQDFLNRNGLSLGI